MLPTSEKREAQPSPHDPSSTWQSLAGHWLSVVDNPELETELQLRRLAAVRRWRGLEGEPTTRP